MYSELLTLEVTQSMRQNAGFGTFFTHSLIETFIIRITEHELPSLKEKVIPHLMTPYS